MAGGRARNRERGRLAVTMIGVSADDGTLERQIVRSVYQRARVPVEDLPEGVFLNWRGGFYFLANCNPRPFVPTLLATAKIVLGHTLLSPAHRLIWTDASVAK